MIRTRAALVAALVCTGRPAIAQGAPLPSSTLAVRNTLKMVHEAPELTEAEAWPRNFELAIEVFQSKDSIEGATAFAEKREPKWTGT